MVKRDANYNERLAYHEAGHALFAHYLGLKVISATIVKNEKTGSEGEVVALPTKKISADENVAYLFAGMQAVKVAGLEKTFSFEGGEISDGVIESRSDVYKALDIINGKYPESKNDREFMYVNGKALAEGILEGYIDALRAIANALIDKGTLTGKEIADIIELNPPIRG